MEPSQICEVDERLYSTVQVHITEPWRLADDVGTIRDVG